MTFWMWYVGCALLVGILAIGRRGGFLLYFVLSMVATPILGLLVLIISMTVHPAERPHR